MKNGTKKLKTQNSMMLLPKKCKRIIHNISYVRYANQIFGYKHLKYYIQ